MELAEVFEMLMLIAFGFAWPASILKSVRSKTSKGKSLSFLLIILSGYVFGICAQYLENSMSIVLIFYAINMLMVSIDLVLYFINRQRDLFALAGVSDPGHDEDKS